MILRSIKWRLQLWHGLILVLVLGGFGYTAFELQRTRENRRVDQELSERMEMLFGPPRRGGRPPGFRGPQPGRDIESEEGRSQARKREGEPKENEGPDRPPGADGPPRGFPPFADESELAAAFPDSGPFYFAHWDRSGRLVRSGGMPEGLTPRRQSKSGLVQVNDYRELHRIMPRGDAVLVARSMRVEIQEMRNLALVLCISGCGILALGLAGGWIVATRAMRPIEKISSTAQKIATGDLSQRITHEENESELGRLVAILNSTFARLESAFTEQVRFTTDVSHELRTPVTVIVSQTQMALLRERPAAEYKESLEACQRAAQRMRRLIESLLQLARLDAGQEKIQTTECDLSKISRDCVELLRPLAEERKIQLNLDLAPAGTIGDPDKLSQVITNLLSNAIQYTPPGGTVTVQTRTQNGLANISVSDNGVGIPAADLPHIFDRFYRVDTSRSRDKGGSGLGLAITRAIVHAHGGTIDATSEEGKGTTFTVVLPTR